MPADVFLAAEGPCARGRRIAQRLEACLCALLRRVDEAARLAVRDLDDDATDPAATRDMTRRAKEHVRRRFLMPRLLRDWLALMHRMAGETVELEVVAGD